jgi:hypothetical protein
MRASFAAAAIAAASLVAPRPAAAQAAVPQAAVPPIAAQVAAQADVGRPAAPAAALVRTAATFRFARRDAAGFPAEVTVADSAGQLVARYRLDGDRAARPMAVTVIDTDLVLQAETRSGLLTVVLDGQNAQAPGPVTGRWWLGDADGTLRGRTR